ncbi:MAG: serine acetyltransferase [Flavipsychrobacter sp.]|nr:serine acetyltransferase [Flavipsychrobacter sp.]
MNESDLLQTLFQRNYSSTQNFPDKELAEEYIDKLFNFLFTAKEHRYDSKEQLVNEYDNLKTTLSNIVYDILRNDAEVEGIIEHFFLSIPHIYNTLLKDATAIVAFDPAAGSLEEVLLAYPGFYATAVYRLAHKLYKLKLNTLSRIWSEFAHSKTGIDIHPGAIIGESFFIDHGTGIVIGETTFIGNNVKIYQGVTLGALNVIKNASTTKRHPTIENNVIIYSGATILGGTTRIGHDSVIGGNVWLTESVEPHSVVYHKSKVIVKDKYPFPAPLNFVI